MALKETTKETIKNHALWTGRVLLCHLLAVALGWAPYPLFLLLVARYTTIDVPMTVFSAVATLVYALMLLVSGNEFGAVDRKPYRWARYRAKGFVIGAAAGVVVFLAGLLTILIADRNFEVTHPQFSIVNINHYVRMILYSPFFWFYKITDTGGTIIPAVTPLGALFVIPFCVIFTGTGYLLGSAGVIIDIGFKKRKKN